MDKETLNRLLTSRKIWGGILFSITCIVIVKIADITSIPIIVGGLTTVWLAVIGGQAAKDYIEKKREQP